MKRSCLGCYACYDGNGLVQGVCYLGFKTKKIETVMGDYGWNKTAIWCSTAPIEQCPKPMTVKKFCEERQNMTVERKRFLGYNV